MNIGLLISELEDDLVKKICIGACQAAREKDVKLFILPGRYLFTEKNVVDDRPYDYQESAIFDYANTPEFDALIIDIERIGKNVPILKKEAFLKRFDKLPVLTLTQQEGFDCVNEVEAGNEQFEQLGYEAVLDAISYAKDGTLPSPSPLQKFSFVEPDHIKTGQTISGLGYQLLHRKYPSEQAYQAFVEYAAKDGIKNCGVFIYDKKIRNTIKYGWEIPDKISGKSALLNGKITEFNGDDRFVDTTGIFSDYTRSKENVFIAGVLFVGQYQLGVMVMDFTANLLSNNYFESLISIVTGVARVAYLEKELKKTNEELYEAQEDLARDDSVLDHIGDKDYLTGGLNRRGFFAKAYDHLKDNFKPGSSAIVAYIHMESLKNINEMFGHDEGDRVVKKVSGILEEVFEGCIYGRIRGDEFAVLDITEEEGKADNFRQEMSTQNAKLLAETSRYINHLQYSICEFGHDENLSLREMLKETDDNLQRLKGRNQL
jgi:diguanylate cyclase (GGDEF)-like protein